MPQQLTTATLQSMKHHQGPSPNAPMNESVFHEIMEKLVRPDANVKSAVHPELISVPPPILPVEDELVWFNLSNPAWNKISYEQLIMPVDVSTSATSKTMEAKRLLIQAMNESLNLQNRQLLISFFEFEKEPDIVHKIGMTPAQLPLLVENNPLVAIELLLKLTHSHSPEITEFLSVLVNMEMSLYSMEVVNRLTTSVDLPAEFVNLYISNCISTCRSITDR